MPKKKKIYTKSRNQRNRFIRLFYTIKTGAQQNQVILAQREGTKLDALQTFFTRLQTFEDTLKEQIEKQTRNTKDGFDPDEVQGL